MDIVRDEFPEEQQAISRRIDDILDAARSKDFDRLAGYHLHSPKFTKFNDIEPLDRQDIDACNHSEQEELGAVDTFDGKVQDLKIDVFGPVAVATGILESTFELDGERGASRIRATLVLADDDGDWKVAHEHLSTFEPSL